MEKHDSKLEEALVTFRQSMPRFWWNIHQGCMEVGFDKAQSFTLLQTYVLGQASGRSSPNTETGPDGDLPAE